jgi:hypothetical protein
MLDIITNTPVRHSILAWRRNFFCPQFVRKNNLCNKWKMFSKTSSEKAEVEELRIVSIDFLCSVIKIIMIMVTGTPFGLLIGFINNLQVVTILTYNTVTHLQSLHANLFTLFAYSVSLNHTLQIKHSVHTLHRHRQTSCILPNSWFQFA